MKVLYIDCFGGFTTSMLLGALIDMGASASFAEQELANMGMGVEIYSDRVQRSGMDAVYAYAKCVGRQIECDFASKYENRLCSMCESLGETFGDSENVCLWAAALCGIDAFGADKIICSPLTEGSGIDKSTSAPVPDSKGMELIKKYGIPLRGADIQKELLSHEGIVFVGENADEFGVLPLGNILCIGYGAGEDVDGCINIVRCVLTETEDSGIMAGELEMLLR